MHEQRESWHTQADDAHWPFLRKLEKTAAYGGCLCLLALMIVVTADVAARYFFNHPFLWSYDIVTLYLTPALFFLVLADSFRSGAQVNVDIIHRRLPRGVQRAAGSLWSFLAALVFALIAYAGATRAWAAFASGDVTAGIVPWPTWPSAALVPLGAGMLAIHLLVRAVTQAASPAGVPAANAHHSEARGAAE
jgi:TRAP-type C4-dicarboxylate transport system permease small subunit